MNRYIAFLRGVNVGGNSMVKMSSLQAALTEAGFNDVRTYINSGNILFSSEQTDRLALATAVTEVINKTFDLHVEVVVFSDKQWLEIIKAAPKWWGANAEWKHNILILLPSVTTTQAITQIGEPVEDLETMAAGKGVVYQSVSFKSFGRTRASKMIGTTVYKQMTIRNYNTAHKLAELLR